MTPVAVDLAYFDEGGTCFDVPEERGETPGPSGEEGIPGEEKGDLSCSLLSISSHQKTWRMCNCIRPSLSISQPVEWCVYVYCSEFVVLSSYYPFEESHLGVRMFTRVFV